ncbi:MAG TPA: carboxylating nicotinate-nucleotide diphosphorylase [Balneolaceae bacterium]|nr:carboxylating nicotinate-nucleotide diphosphorylase [Balneolaceae bacterium]
MDVLQMEIPERKVIDELIQRAFEEDIKSGDITTDAIINKGRQADAVWCTKEQGIIAGLDIAKAVFRALDPKLEWHPKVEDGDHVASGQLIVEISGSCRAILSAERTALNLAQRMSGIATKTHRLVEAIAGYPAKILDTRKTVPGLRQLDKYAVVAGGGTNHRMGLFDMALIKDNHIVAAGSIAKAVEMVQTQHPNVKIEVETTSLDEVNEALSAKADLIMLDNMNTDMMREAVTLIDGKAKTEASGNITLQRVKEVAKTGVDYISVGALTHSVKAFDISQTLRKIY